ncbi:HNH endonuclease domain-containing protein [Halanaerocella petrolearia]
MKLPMASSLNIQAFENMLTLKRITNSYKLYWFTSILDGIKKGQQEFGFQNLALKMVTKSWYSIVEYKLNFGSQDKLGKLVLDIYNSYDLSKDIKESDLFDFLQYIIAKNEEIKERVNKLCKFVPYRLLSPFYFEIVGVKDYKKNKLIEKLSNQDNKAIYQIQDQKIIINQNWFNYIYKNQTIVEGWLKYKLIYFLQKRNPNVPAIPFKLSAPQKRNLRKAKKYWGNVLDIVSFEDIYTEKEIDSETNISLDHFIPWSFVLHDELWNLVPTFKKINSKKNDKLPDLDLLLDDFCEVQYKGFKIGLEYGFSRKAMEDYLNLKQSISLSKEIKKEYFVSALRNTIKPLYQIAKNQGFMVLDGDYLHDDRSEEMIS